MARAKPFYLNGLGGAIVRFVARRAVTIPVRHETLLFFLLTVVFSAAYQPCR